LNQVRTVLLIQVFHSFASGILGVALPLMMKARNVDVIMMGLVFATMPLIMQFGRMFCATVSDFLGRKPFFVSNGFLGIVSSFIYYLSRTPLEFLFGKVVEGTKEGTVWAVNRAFLLEKSEGHWRILVHLRTVVYVAYAIGSLLAGFFVVWFLFEGTMLLCALFGFLVVLLSLLLVGERKEKFSFDRVLRFLDLRKKDSIFKIFLILLFVMGVSFGFIGGFVIPWFLSGNGFTAESIGLIVGTQTFLAGLFSHVFAKSSNFRRLILSSGVLYSVTFLLLGFSSFILAGIIVIFYGVVQGIASVGQEAILSRICAKESYGTDIGLLMTGLHIGETLSLALSGYIISLCGFMTLFVLAALTYVVFYVGSYLILKE